MQRQGFGQEVDGRRGGFAFAGPCASSVRIMQADCRRILFVTQDPQLARGAMEFADVRCVQAKVTDFERALEEVKRANRYGLVVVVDCADLEQGLRTRKRAVELGVHVIALTTPGLSEEQREKFKEVKSGPIFFIRDFGGNGRDAGSYLDLVLRYTGPEAAEQELKRFLGGKK